ncbi:helix-turn-helix transcriptional regulator [Phyllobacterium sp. 22552]|uniref:helix-turn-helix transcriptional regulator n=1 Tax=Phyllobacterium sp. 22552 TaxID=3453941 RepID=UPI003F8645B0
MAAPDKFLSGPAVRKRYGVSAQSLHRWMNDSDLAFPRPMLIRRKLYFKEADLLAWEAKHSVSLDI